jgi:hypothetical protein
MGNKDHRWKLRVAAGASLIGSLMLVHTQQADAKTYTALNGLTVTLPDDQRVLGNPAISPDGSHIAYVRAVGQRPDWDDPQPSEVVVTNLADHRANVLINSGADTEWYLKPVVRVTFAEDSKHLFAERAHPGDSDSVRVIDLVTGREGFLSWGVDISVLRDGPWRGDLLMGVHTCYDNHFGCDYPVHVVTPAGRSVYVVPGTAGADHASQLRAWLAKRGWRAW